MLFLEGKSIEKTFGGQPGQSGGNRAFQAVKTS